MKKYILEEKEDTTKVEDEEETTSEIEESGSDIYFYSKVDKKSIFELNKKLRSVDKDLRIQALKLDFPYNPEIKLHINSSGGSLLDCFATVDYIRTSKVPVHSIVEGSAASAATLMSVVCHKRSIMKHSFMLIHQLSSGVWGKFESMKDEVENCNVFMDTLNGIYEKYTKIPKNTLKEILKRDIYLDSKTCLKYGLVDKIIE